MLDFSVIIPLYNKENAIKETIESVLVQSYQNFEIVIVDDGSTDNSASIAKSIFDQRIHYYIKENGGVSSARNFGIIHSQYEWLIFLDADDLLQQNALETIVKMVKELPGYFIYGGNMQLYGGLRCKWQPEFVQISTNPFRDWWKMRLAPEMGTFAMHKSLIKKYGYFDERMSCFEDLDFTSRLMEHIPFVYTSECIKIYRKEYSTLSVVPQPIEKEFAYYLTNERICGSFWKQLVLAYNVWDTRRHREDFGDRNGVDFYSQQLKMFSPLVRVYIYLMGLKRKIGSYIHGRNK